MSVFNEYWPLACPCEPPEKIGKERYKEILFSRISTANQSMAVCPICLQTKVDERKAREKREYINIEKNIRDED